jgi:hypothetical protein
VKNKKSKEEEGKAVEQISFGLKLVIESYGGH